MSDPITAKVIAAVVSVKNIPAETVTSESQLTELGFDSLDVINLLFELEEAFNVSIPDDEARRVRTVSDIVAGIRRLTAAAAGAAGGPGEHAA